MIFKFWEKQKELPTKKLLLRKLIRKVDIPETDKTLFLEAIWVVPEENIENLYNEVTLFIKNFELKEIDDWENVEKYFQEKSSIGELSWLRQSIIDWWNLLDSNIAMESIDKMWYLWNKELVKNLNNSFNKHLRDIA